MPTYEYLCQTCSHRFETWQKMTDEPLTVCPECGKHIRRVLYPAGIVFKGSGFYKTDHGAGVLPAGELAKSENGTESKSGAEGTTSTAGESKTSESPTPASASSTKPGRADDLRIRVHRYHLSGQRAATRSVGRAVPFLKHLPGWQ